LKVVINRNSSNFELSQDAYKKLSFKGWESTSLNQNGEPQNKNADLILYHKDNQLLYCINPYKHNVDTPEFRCYRDIINVVEELGDESNSLHTHLIIVEVDSGLHWIIEKTDDVENISYSFY
jgi:hypothetical protein